MAFRPFLDSLLLGDICVTLESRHADRIYTCTAL